MFVCDSAYSLFISVSISFGFRFPFSSVLCGFWIRFLSFRFRLVRFHSFYVSDHLYILSIPFLFRPRPVSVALRPVPISLPFPYSVPFCVSFRFRWVIVWFVFFSDSVFLFYIRFDLVPISGRYPFSLSLTFRCVWVSIPFQFRFCAFRFRFCSSSILLRFRISPIRLR